VRSIVDLFILTNCTACNADASLL